MQQTLRTQRPLLHLAFMLALAAALATPAAAITWGEPDGEAHGNVGAMLVEIPDIGWVQACSGTLISPHVFLTAGHCTYFAATLGDDNGTHVRVNFAPDALDFDDPSTWREVETVVTHPQYGGPRSDPRDVGILILAKAVLDRTPPARPPLGLLDQLKKQQMLRQGADEQDFVVVGYGGTLDWPPPAVTYEDQRQSAESEYQALLPVWLRLSQNAATGDGGTCYGDSGGPAFWIDPDTGDEVLVGITSWGDIPCVSAGFNYRTDIPQTLDFVDAVLEYLSESWLAEEPEPETPTGHGAKAKR